jgi:hypothetical protein
MSSATVSPKQGGQLIGRDQLPARLAISQRKVDALLASKALKSFKIGKKRVVSETALTDFIRKQEQTSR